MSSKCNGKPVSPAVRRRRLQRAKTAVAARLNILGIVQRVGIEQVGLLTLTFSDPVTDAKIAQTRFKSLRTGVLMPRYGGYLRVFERQRSGRIHYHVLLPMKSDIRSGYKRPAAGSRARCGNPCLRLEWAFLRETLPRYGFGWCQLEPLIGTAEQAAAYLTKTLEGPECVRATRDSRVRVVEVSRSLRSANSRFFWLTDNGTQWRRKLAAHVALLVDSGELQPGAGLCDLNQRYGPSWALYLRPMIEQTHDLQGWPVNHSVRAEHRPSCVGSVQSSLAQRSLDQTGRDSPSRSVRMGPFTKATDWRGHATSTGKAPVATGPPTARDASESLLLLNKPNDKTPMETNDSYNSRASQPDPRYGASADRRPMTGGDRVQLEPLVAARNPLRALHALCTAFPPIDAEAFDELVGDIQQNGLREPIVLLDGQVLDGRNRYHACLQAGVEARFRDFGSDKGDGADPVAFVLSKNLRRRHLTVSQQAAAVSKTQDWSLAQRRGGDRGNQYTGPRQGAPVPFASSADRAAIAGVGVRTQKDADLVAREAPELLDKVIAGEVSAKAAAAQVRAAKQNTVGVEGAPTAEDFDSPPSSDASALDDDEPAPVPAAQPVKAAPADPRDARIAELLQQIEDMRDALEMAEEKIAQLEAAGVDADALKAIKDRDARIAGLKSQSREWQLKCNELVKQVKAQRVVIKRLERGW